jgi:tripartite-type tricarboxylate transporter receptor subunit TctC
MGPPELPADKIKILRDSFSKAMNDPALIADAQKRRWDLDPTPGPELEATAKELMAQPPAVIARMKKFLAD